MAMYLTQDRVYYYPPNGAPRVFVADKGVEIPLEVAKACGLVDDTDVKKRDLDKVENKKRTAPQTKKSNASADQE